MKLKQNLIVLVGIASLAVCCESMQNFDSIPPTQFSLPETPFRYRVTGTTDHLPTLGRVLFYDPRLSVNNSVSCGSCHKQALAFTDNARFSRGFENRITTRNSMPIQNIISNTFLFNPIIPELPAADTTISDPIVAADPPELPGGYLPVVMPEEPVSHAIDDSDFIINTDFFFTPSALFWDGRETSLEVMVTKPIMNHIEMGIHDLKVLANKLSDIPEYQPLFNNAFGKVDITEDKIAIGLSAFLLSIRSTQSKFDHAIAGKRQLSGLEEQGRQLFFDKFDCNSCHQSPGFSNIGLEESPSDIGFAGVSGDPADAGKFKIPSLRNIGLTAPYMHDGRFATLEDVIGHYSGKIRSNPNLDDRLKNPDGKAKRLNISATEKKALVAFLHTLTDFEMVTDPKFSNPFVLR